MVSGLASIWRMGRFSEQRAQGSTSSRLIVFSASVAYLLAIVFLFGVLGITGARIERDASRLPQIDWSSEEKSARRWQQQTVVVKDRYTQLIYLFGSANDPHPRGLEKFPSPGELYVSPRMMQDGSGIELAAQLGATAVKEIGYDGVVDRQELIAYFQPPPDRQGEPFGYNVLGFGLEPGNPERGLLSSGSVADQPPLSSVLLVSGVCILIPATLAYLIAIGQQRIKYDKRLRILTAMGASPTQKIVFSLSANARPFSLAIGLSTILLIVPLFAPIPILGTDFYIEPRDVQAGGLTIVIGYLIAIVSALLWQIFLTLVPLPKRKLRIKRKITGFIPVFIRAIALPIVCIAYVALLRNLLPDLSPTGRVVLVYLGVLIIWITVVPFSNAATQIIYQRLLIWFPNSAAMLMGGRSVLNPATGIKRIAASLSLLVVLIINFGALVNVQDGRIESALRYQQQYGNQIVNAGPGFYEFAKNKNGADQVAAVSFFMYLVNNEHDVPGHAVLIGKCSSLQALEVECTDKDMQAPETVSKNKFFSQIAMKGITRKLDVRVMPDDGADFATDTDMMKHDHFVVSLNGKDLPLAEYNTHLGTTQNYWEQLPSPVSENHALNEFLNRKFQWLAFMTSTLLVLTILAVGFGSVGSSGSGVSEHGIISAWGENLGLVIKTNMVRIALPLTIATVIGNVIGYWSISPFLSPPFNVVLPANLYMASIITPICIIISAWMLTSILQQRGLKTWAPNRNY